MQDFKNYIAEYRFMTTTSMMLNMMEKIACCHPKPNDLPVCPIRDNTVSVG